MDEWIEKNREIVAFLFQMTIGVFFGYFIGTIVYAIRFGDCM